MPRPSALRALIRFAVSLPLALALAAAPLAAQALGTPVRVTLLNGDVLTGTLLSRTPEQIVIEHALLGRIFLDPAAILPPGSPLPAGLPTRPAVTTPALAALTAPGTTPPPPTPPAAATAPAPLWTGVIDLGGNVTTGNTSTADFRAGLEARRETDATQLDLGLTYRYKTENDTATDDNRKLTAREQWLESNTPWRTFIEGSVEQDRFKDFDSRVRVGAGRAYAFEDTDATQLVGRFGLGAVQEIGAPVDSVMLESILGLDYEHQLAERQRFVSGITLHPSISQAGDYQAEARAVWELQISETDPWALRLGVDAQYDSDPGSAGSTDVHYFASLGYRF